MSPVDDGLSGAIGALQAWLEERDWVGHDPFDALLSPFARPVRGARWLEVALTQFRRRSRRDLSDLLRIPPHVNPKALSLSAEADLVDGDVEAADRLLDRLLALQGPDGGWGYPFPWANRHFRAPAGTPSGVVTGFAVRSLLARRAYAGAPARMQEAIDRAAGFVRTRLPRLDTPAGMVFGYTPGDRRAVYNASLLAAEVLAAADTPHVEDDDLVRAAVDAVLRVQRPDGLLPYGASSRDAFVDSYHTGYVLSSLRRIGAAGVFDAETSARVDRAIDQGLEAWTRTFLHDRGVGHRPDAPFPVDLHGVAQGILTLVEFGDRIPDGIDRAGRLAHWAISAARRPDGAFVYLWSPGAVHTAAYLRWVQCWMLLALTTLREARASA